MPTNNISSQDHAEPDVWWLTAEADPALYGSPPPYVRPEDRESPDLAERIPGDLS